MATIRTQAGNDEKGFFHGKAAALTSVSRALIMGTVLLAATAAQAADSSDRILPPNPADVAMLRQLLALQHPALRDAAAMQVQPAVATPAVTTEPNQQSSQAPAATEGEACVRPQGQGAATCATGTEAAAVRTAKLGGTFRESLDRAMAAAGYDGAKL